MGVLPRGSTQLHSLRAHSRSARKGPSQSVLARQLSQKNQKIHPSCSARLRAPDSWLTHDRFRTLRILEQCAVEAEAYSFSAGSGSR